MGAMRESDIASDPESNGCRPTPRSLSRRTKDDKHANDPAPGALRRVRGPHRRRDAGIGGGRRFGGFGDATTTTETYRVGTLVVDLSDTAAEKLVWRGSASDTLSDKSEKNIDNLDKGVVKMFKKFPPAPSKK